MFQRLHERLRRLPLVRLGGVLVVVAGVVEALDALGGIDISPLVQWLGFDPALVVAMIGTAKIGLRFILTVSAAFAAKRATE